MLLSADYMQFFLPEFVDCESGLLELFENVSGVWFLRHNVKERCNSWLHRCDM